MSQAEATKKEVLDIVVTALLRLSEEDRERVIKAAAVFFQVK